MYIDAPVFNIIRSAGKPGAIEVRVLSPGLASAEVCITATAAPADTSRPPSLSRRCRKPTACRLGHQGALPTPHQ